MRPLRLVLRALCAAVAMVAGACSSGGSPRAVRPPVTTTAVAVKAPASPEVLAADATGQSVDLFAAPDVARPTSSLANPTAEGVPLAFLVLEQTGSWFRVRVPQRPNGATAWVKASQVATRPIASHIEISLGERSLTLTRAGRAELTAKVAIGAPSTPTPTGEFYVDALVQIDNQRDPYAPWELSVAGFSDVLQSFGGGNGQIAIHGWRDISVIGKAVSHGCVRMTPDDVSALAALVQVGTPVTIKA